MTRSSIEFATKIFLLTLVCVFIWTVVQVLKQVGLM